MNGDKEKNTQLLKYIGKNAKMGGDNLETVLPDIKDERLKETLRFQVQEKMILLLDSTYGRFLTNV